MGFAKHVKVRNENFGSVIFETLKEKVYATNETGSDILQLLEQNKTEEEIITELADRYGCDSSTVEKDVKEYIVCLKQNNILT